MVLTRILQQVPCRRFRVRCYAVLVVLSPSQVCSFASQYCTLSLDTLTQVESDCLELLPKAAVTISEAVAAVDV